MRLRDILVDPGTDQLSHTKLWNNIANLVATYVVLDLHRVGQLSIEWMLLYLAVVGGVAVLSKWTSLRFGSAAAEKQTSTGGQP